MDVLSRWLNPRHHDPSRIREDARCRPCLAYVAVDHLFDRAMLAREELGESLHHEAWLRWVHAALDVSFDPASRASVTDRRTPAGDPGVAPNNGAARITVLIYTAPERCVEDGGLVQIWRRYPLDGSLEAGELAVELSGLPPCKLRLVDQLVPLENRAILIAHKPPVVWSVTPNRKEHRVVVGSIG